MRVVKLNNGRIILIHGDSLEVLKHVKPSSIDLVLADPPYYGVVNDDWDNDWSTLQEHLDWSNVWIQLAIKTMQESGSFYIWGGVGERSDTIIHLYLLIKQQLYFKDWITWKKSRGMGNRRGWMYTREECLWYVKNNKQFLWNTAEQYSEERRKRDKGMPAGEIRESQNGYKALSEFKRLTNVWDDISERSYDVINNIEHTTPKPLKAIDRIVAAHTSHSQHTVLDPFLGSGTTGETCVKLNRRFIGIEKNKQSFDFAVARIEKALVDYVPAVVN